MRLSILYDNEAEKDFKAAWGFSCLVDNGKQRVLFDTGGEPGILRHNMKLLGINKKGIDTIVISHDHWDHTGGLGAVLHPRVTVYIPASASEELKRAAAMSGRVVVVEQPMDVAQDIHVTGELGGTIGEQSLVLQTERGSVILFGCAHPGLINIIESCARWGKAFGVIGGFHGFDELPYLKRLHLIGPCHCTRNKEKIKRTYPEKCLDVRAGKVFEV